jgi:hypothetical protein
VQRLLSLLIAAVTAISLIAGCGGDDNDDAGDRPTPVPPAPQGPQNPVLTKPSGVGPKPPTVTTTADQGFKATLTTSRAEPRVGPPWGIEVTARSAEGDPLPARAVYVFLFGDQEVARPAVFRFRGEMRDGLEFPALAAGRELTFRVEVTAAGTTQRLERKITVQRDR